MSRHSDFIDDATLRAQVLEHTRRYSRSGPSLIGEVLAGMDGSHRPFFPFVEWAKANSFKYPPAAKELLRNCGSAAEAFFAQPFTLREGVEYCDRRAFTKDWMLELQLPCARYYIDAAVSHGKMSLAIEIDGMGFHHKSKQQVAADYLRERRIVQQGYTVIRFTAQEVFSDPAECWRQVEAIFTARRKGYKP